jgi:hypothetical protein
MLKACEQQNNLLPKFEEMDNFFRITLYPKSTKSTHPLLGKKPVYNAKSAES